MDTKVKSKQTRQLGELVLLLTSQHATARLSPVSLYARFCTPPEVKFNVFRQLKRGEEKSILKIFSFYLIRTSCRFNRANTKKSVIYALTFGFEVQTRASKFTFQFKNKDLKRTCPIKSGPIVVQENMFFSNMTITKQRPQRLAVETF